MTASQQVPDDLSEAIWRAMLDAELNHAYWGHLRNRYIQREKWFKILLASLSSSTVASWGIWEEAEMLWKVLSAVSAILAIALPILDWPKSIKEISGATEKWFQLSVEYQDLWLDVASDGRTVEGIRREFSKLRDIEKKTGSNSPSVPKDSKLIKSLFDEILRRRGLN